MLPYGGVFPVTLHLLLCVYDSLRLISRRICSLGPYFILIESISAGLGHPCGVNEPGVFGTEEVRVLRVHLVKELQAVHLKHRRSNVTPDVGGLGVKDEGIQEVGHRIRIVAHASMCETNISHSPHIVRSQVKCLVIYLKCTHCVHIVGHGSAVLVPQSVLHGVLADAVFEETGGLCEVALDERQHTKCKRYVSILGLDAVSLKEGSSNTIELDCFFRNCTDQVIEVWVILKPIEKVRDGFSLLKLVGAGDAKAEERV